MFSNMQVDFLKISYETSQTKFPGLPKSQAQQAFPRYEFGSNGWYSTPVTDYGLSEDHYKSTGGLGRSTQW